MNLQEAIQEMDRRGILIALNLGEHLYCNIEHNCPLAVKLRRNIEDSGVDLQKLLEEFQSTPVDNPFSSLVLPEISTRFSVSIGEKDIEFNLDDILETRIGKQLELKFDEFEVKTSSFNRIGKYLYESYRSEVRKVREAKVLPQLVFSVEEMFRFNCVITADGDGYLFLFPLEYNPQYIVNGGVRYKLTDEDIEALRYLVCLNIPVTRNNKVLTPILIYQDGRRFLHYHGSDDYNCWGTITLHRDWDGTLDSLHRLFLTIKGALYTVNNDSPLLNSPPGFPHIQDLYGRSIRLGREGELENIEDSQVEQPPRETSVPQEVRATRATRATGWGRERR